LVAPLDLKRLAQLGKILPSLLDLFCRSHCAVNRYQ
jgi:hypothetical protein